MSSALALQGSQLTNKYSLKPVAPYFVLYVHPVLQNSLCLYVSPVDIPLFINTSIESSHHQIKSLKEWVRRKIELPKQACGVALECDARENVGTPSVIMALISPRLTVYTFLVTVLY